MDDISEYHVKHLLRGGRSIMKENPSTRGIFAAQSSELNFPTMGLQSFEHTGGNNNYYAGRSAFGDAVRHHNRHRSGIRSGLKRHIESA
jgi:hypothetical protein